MKTGAHVISTRRWKEKIMLCLNRLLVHMSLGTSIPAESKTIKALLAEENSTEIRQVSNCVQLALCHRIKLYFVREDEVRMPTLRFPNWSWALVGGTISVLLSLLLWTEWPELGLWFIGCASASI